MTTSRERADCTVQALHAATGLSYEAARALAEDAGRRPGRRFRAGRLIEHAKRRGLKFSKLRFAVRSVARFCREYPAGRFYALRQGHAFAVVDGKVSDHTPAGARIVDAWAFMGGAVAPKLERAEPAAKPPVNVKALKYARTLEAIKRWEGKAKRAATKLKKLRRSLAAQERAALRAVPAAAGVH